MPLCRYAVTPRRTAQPHHIIVLIPLPGPRYPVIPCPAAGHQRKTGRWVEGLPSKPKKIKRVEGNASTQSEHLLEQLLGSDLLPNYSANIPCGYRKQTEFKLLLVVHQLPTMAAATVFDSTLFGNIFGTEEARQAFSERSYVANLIKAECALAEAEEAEGIVPAGTAAVLKEHCDVSKIDWQLLAARTEIVGYPVLPLVEQMSKWVPEETCKCEIALAFAELNC